MKQLYSITRTEFYEKLCKNKKGWKVTRTKNIFLNAVYLYGCNLTKGQESIKIKPSSPISGKRTRFDFKYENLNKPEESYSLSDVNMQTIREKTNQIMYS